MAIELSDTATVVVPQARVSEEQYQAMAGEFCYLQWSGAADLARLDSFAVLNEYRRQGWVLEEPAKSCVEFGEAAGDAALTTLLSFTHLY